MVSARQAGTEVVRWRRSRIGYLHCVYRAVAGSQLPDVRQVYLHSRQLRRGVASGQRPWADGPWMVYLHPTQDPRRCGAVPVDGRARLRRHAQAAGDGLIKADYARFAVLSVERFVYFWAGSPKATQPPAAEQAKNSLFLSSSVLMFWGLGRAVRLRKPGAWLLVWLVLLYPAIYYFVYPIPRYRVRSSRRWRSCACSW